MHATSKHIYFSILATTLSHRFELCSTRHFMHCHMAFPNLLFEPTSGSVFQGHSHDVHELGKWGYYNFGCQSLKSHSRIIYTTSEQDVRLRKAQMWVHMLSVLCNVMQEKLNVGWNVVFRHEGEHYIGDGLLFTSPHRQVFVVCSPLPKLDSRTGMWNCEVRHDIFKRQPSVSLHLVTDSKLICRGNDGNVPHDNGRDGYILEGNWPMSL